MKKEINKTLGNSLRCILPSFWWKRLLGKMVDKIESAESSASSAMRVATLAGLEASDKQDRLVSGSNIKTICGNSILGSGNITPDPSMKVYIPMGGALGSYQSYNQSFYRRVRDGGNWVNSWRAIAVTASENKEVVLLGVSYNTTQGCRILISGFQEADITDKYECVLLEDGSVSSVTKVEGESGGSSITIDSELSATSENPVQNKVIYENLCEMSEEYTQMYEELGASVHEVTADIYTKLLNKVDYVDGKQLSTEDFTSALKTKLEGLNNYDDTAIQNALNSLTTQINTLVSGDASAAIESFNEIIAFLNGVEDSESLDSIIASIEQQIAAKQDKLVSGTNIKTINGESILGEGNIVVNVDTSNLATKEELNAKQDVIEDLETIRSGAAKGATALQEHQDISHLASKEELQNLQNEVIANEEVVAAAFNDVNERINAISENVSGTTVTKEELESTVETINQTISDNKSATDTAIEGLETSIGNVDAKFANYATTESLTTEITNLTNEIIANEEVVAAALNDLNERLNNAGGGSSGGSGVVTFYAAENFTDEIKAKNKAAYETYITAGGTKGVVFNLVDSGINLFPVNSYMEGDILLLEFITTLFSDSNTIESLLLPCHPDGTVEA